MVAEFQWSMHAYMYVPCNFVMGGPYWYRNQLTQNRKKRTIYQAPTHDPFSPCLYHGVSLHEHTHFSQDYLLSSVVGSRRKKKKNMHTEACNERNSWMIQPLYPGAYPCTLHGWSSTVRSLVFCLIWSDPNIVLHFYHTMTEFLEVFGLIAPTLPNSNLAI